MTAGPAPTPYARKTAKLPSRVPDVATLWFRVLLPSGALGPGKIDLMRAVADKGSVSGAARALRMSHARSVKLVVEINALAPTPLIDTRAGGQFGGGTSLTPLGIAVIEAYAVVEQSVRGAAGPPLVSLSKLLAAPSSGDQE